MKLLTALLLTKLCAKRKSDHNEAIKQQNAMRRSRWLSARVAAEIVAESKLVHKKLAEEIEATKAIYASLETAMDAPGATRYEDDADLEMYTKAPQTTTIFCRCWES